MNKFFRMFKKYVTLALLALVFGCTNRSDKVKKEEDGFTTDTSLQVYVPPFTNKPGTFNGLDTTLFSAETIDVGTKRKWLLLSIDSTYSAIRQIEIIKNEMILQPVSKLSMQERNLRSKALNQLNLLENALTRQTDETVLAHLKQYTAKLEQINDRTEKNTERLHELSDKLVKVGLIMENVTNVLAFCVSKGIIKPTTPKSSSPQIVKSTLN